MRLLEIVWDESVNQVEMAFQSKKREILCCVAATVFG